MKTSILRVGIAELKATLETMGFEDGDAKSGAEMEASKKPLFFQSVLEHAKPQSKAFVVWDFLTPSLPSYADNRERTSLITFEIAYVVGDRRPITGRIKRFSELVETKFEGWIVNLNGIDRDEATKETTVSYNVSKVFSEAESHAD